MATKKPAPKAAATKAKTPEKASVPAVQKNKNLPANADDMTKAMAADSGKGVSTLASDNIVPLIYLLQSLSPQVLKQKPESYIKGAEAGDFWFRGTKEVNKNLLVVLAHMAVEWVEWRPNRGGFVGRHGSTRPAEATYVKDPKNPKRGQWELENGNYVAETREHALLIVDEEGNFSPYVLPLSGSNHGVARQWMTNAGRKRVPGTDNRAPLFGYAWKLSTVAKSNDDGDWFGLAVEDGGDEGEELLTWNLPNGPEIYKAARQLNADFETGKKTSDQADDLTDDGKGSDDEDADV